MILSFPDSTWHQQTAGNPENALSNDNKVPKGTLYYHIKTVQSFNHFIIDRSSMILFERRLKFNPLIVKKNGPNSRILSVNTMNTIVFIVYMLLYVVI